MNKLMNFMRLLTKKRRQVLTQGLVKIASNSIRIAELGVPKKQSKRLDLSMFNFSNDDFETKGNALATLKASVLSAFSNQAEKEEKRITKNRMLGFSKLVGTIEKNILLKKIDFWLPLRVHCAYTQPGLKSANSSIGNSNEKYYKPTVLKL